MEIDILDYITVTVLLQKNKSLTFMSKKMIAIEQNYKIIEKKMLIII